MKKAFVIVAALTLFTSCKTKQAVVAEGAAEGSKAASEIIEGHYSKPLEYKTLLIKADADYKDGKQSQSVSAEVRIKKDESILVIVRYLGITVAKGLITPKEVSYYERLGNTYFKGNYAVLSRWLGTELNYTKVQNMLLGEALDDLHKGTYKASVDNGLYKLTGKDKNTVKEFLFEGANYLLKKQHVEQGGTDPRSIDISYPAHSNYSQGIVPAGIKIEAEQKDRVNLDIEYKSVKFDEPITFPYEVPEGFNQIFIDEK
jgi:hypothetical protein